ncbi:MAG: glycosyltransferase family 4 protein [Candidatus Korarchaeota archaeon]|nr:glycosyltransferase family 4 protein [Candidatus Korarchaeota archaeon]NIU84399.1 glycosyltransferase [Candidatus Thorarchaeota archaeon]NIW14508.1 glycosyltransferase [Candidatus Thorarchaeota archaeon]NIW52587.1 glycosyltransferase [Candidatus Korarchaeota archaeon]
MTLKIGIFSCYYQFLALSEDTDHMIKIYRNKYQFDAKVISTKCACHTIHEIRSPKSRCDWIRFPFLNQRKPFLFLAYILDLFRGILFYFKSMKYDIIHFQQVSGAFSFVSLIPLLALPSSPKKLVLVHFLHPLQRKFPWLNEIYKHADLVGVHSQSTKDELLRLSTLPEEEIKIIPLGVHIPELTDRTRDKLIFLGRPTPEKGFLTALKALKILKEHGKPQFLHIFGAYTENEREIALNYAKKLDVEDYLYWGGSLSETELNHKLQEAIVLFVLHTYSHGGSSTLVHGMANGAPIIATDVGGLKETLGKGGILIPPNNPEALAAAIQKLITNRDLRIRYSERSRERAETIFSWETVIDYQLQLLGALPNS